MASSSKNRLVTWVPPMYMHTDRIMVTEESQHMMNDLKKSFKEAGKLPTKASIYIGRQSLVGQEADLTTETKVSDVKWTGKTERRVVQSPVEDMVWELDVKGMVERGEPIPDRMELVVNPNKGPNDPGPAVALYAAAGGGMLLLLATVVWWLRRRRIRSQL